MTILDVDLVVRSVGYRGEPMPEVLRLTGQQCIPNVDGRVMDGDTAYRCTSRVDQAGTDRDHRHQQEVRAVEPSRRCWQIVRQGLLTCPQTDRLWSIY